METVRIRDPGWKKVGSGIRDKHPGSVTLLVRRKLGESATPRLGESFFDYEYLREFEAKIGTARKVV
jgi:hypothetical protein